GTYVEQAVVDEEKKKKSKKQKEEKTKGEEKSEGETKSEGEKKPDAEKTRITWYLDTREMGFRQRGFILRVREEKPGEFELNLKFRGPDRYIAAAQDVSTAVEAKNNKFEEDVLPPFRGQFSRSATVETPSIPAPPDVRRVAEVFPGLGALGLPGDTEVEVANGFKAFEVVRRIGGFRTGEGPTVTMSLSFWYLRGQKLGFPMVGEFSFDYDALETQKGDLEQFPLETVKLAERVFRALQLQSGWLDLEGTTKSAFAVSGL
ncbi:MAG TPA: hypothetical protein VFR81_16750, partial [Longimicrobium sp.]|nr:hypothetical protein [Longimicrobium sp.]